MKPLQFPLEVKVSNTSQGYTTQTVRGQRASCTYSDESAMGRLADKLTRAMALPIGSLSAGQLPAKGMRYGTTVWQISQRRGGGV